MSNENVRTLKVISVCSVCGEPVGATKHDKAYRHGFDRYRKRKIDPNGIGTFDSYSQEDNKPCKGTGVEVVYKRYKHFKENKKYLKKLGI